MSFQEEFNRRVVSAILNRCTQVTKSHKVVSFKELPCPRGDKHEFVANTPPHFEYSEGYRYSEYTEEDPSYRVAVDFSCAKCGENWPYISLDISGESLVEFMREITND